MGRRVLVTGGAGFIGSHLAEALIGAGHTVAVVDNLVTGRRAQVPAGARFFERDITGNLDDVFEDFGPEVVVHQAAQVSVGVSMHQPEADAQVNILGSIRLLEQCRRHRVSKILYASSGAVYGALETLPLREDMRPRPFSCYGASKYAVEHYLRTAGGDWGLEWAALRYSNVYGPRQRPDGEAGVVAIFSSRLVQGRPATIFGDGELTRDYVYVGDVAAANLALLDQDLRGHADPVFNVSTGIATSVNRLYDLLRSVLGVSRDAEHGPPRPGDIEHSRLDSAKLRDLTGWRAATDLEQGLRQTAAAVREEHAKPEN